MSENNATPSGPHPAWCDQALCTTSEDGTRIHVSPSASVCRPEYELSTTIYKTDGEPPRIGLDLADADLTAAGLVSLIDDLHDTLRHFLVDMAHDEQGAAA